MEKIFGDWHLSLVGLVEPFQQIHNVTKKLMNFHLWSLFKLQIDTITDKH